MMDLLTVKIVAIVGLGVISLLFGLIPIQMRKCLFKGGQNASNKRQMLLSFFLCFGAGVLFAAVMIHMMPEIREGFERVKMLEKSNPHISDTVAKALPSIDQKIKMDDPSHLGTHSHDHGKELDKSITGEHHHDHDHHDHDHHHHPHDHHDHDHHHSHDHHHNEQNASHNHMHDHTSHNHDENHDEISKMNSRDTHAEHMHDHSDLNNDGHQHDHKNSSDNEHHHHTNSKDSSNIDTEHTHHHPSHSGADPDAASDTEKLPSKSIDSVDLITENKMNDTPSNSPSETPTENVEHSVVKRSAELVEGTTISPEDDVDSTPESITIIPTEISDIDIIDVISKQTDKLDDQSSSMKEESMLESNTEELSTKPEPSENVKPEDHTLTILKHDHSYHENHNHHSHSKEPNDHLTNPDDSDGKEMIHTTGQVDDMGITESPDDVENTDPQEYSDLTTDPINIEDQADTTEIIPIAEHGKEISNHISDTNKIDRRDHSVHSDDADHSHNTDHKEHSHADNVDHLHDAEHEEHSHHDDSKHMGDHEEHTEQVERMGKANKIEDDHSSHLEHAGHSGQSNHDHSNHTDDESHSGHNEHSYPLAELIICAGVFLVYFIEELISKFVGHHGSHGHSHIPLPNHNSHSHKNGKVHSNGYSGYKKKFGSGSRGAWTPTHIDGIENPAFTEDSDAVSWNSTNKIDQSYPDEPRRYSSNPPSVSTDVTEQPDCSQILLSNIRSVLMVLALSFHSTFEGLAIGLQENSRDVLYLTLAVAAHKLVIHFSVSLELMTIGVSTFSVLLYTFVMALTNPIGGSLGMFLTADIAYFSDPNQLFIITVLQGLAGGTILYVVFFEIMERERSKEGNRMTKFFAFLLGFAFLAVIENFGAHSHGPIETGHNH